MLSNIVEAEAWGLEQRIRGREQACLLMTDFCVVFPSLAIPWFMHVLRCVGSCEAVNCLFAKLYQEQTATVILGGKRH
eukprot:4856319-Pyramimonas_sp.AAC.1